MKYGVSVPITGIAWVEVDADDEDEAIEEALNAYKERSDE